MSKSGIYMVKCPQCGQAISVSLANYESIRCDACGYDGPLPPETVERLGRAFDIMRSLGTKERHLDARQKKALTSSFGHYLALAAIVFFSGLPSFVLFAAGIIMLLLTPPAVAFAVACFTPSVLLAIVAIAAIAQVRKSRRILAETAVASPPAQPGEPASCRLCGAPLGTARGAVVRCEFCDTDNFIDPEALRKATRTQFEAQEGFEKQIVERIEKVRKSARAAGCAVLGAAVGAPVISVVFFFLLFMVMVSIDRPVNDKTKYVLLETPSGRCLASQSFQSEKGTWVLFSEQAPPGAESGTYVQPDEAKWVELDSLVGKEVCVWSTPPVRGKVERVHGTMLGTNHVVIDGADHQEIGTCLIEIEDYRCSRDAKPEPVAEEAAVVEEPASPEPGQWDCETDGDCLNSCMMGAVNVAWYEKNKKAECKDGCAAKMIGPPKCINGECAAFDRNGNPEQGCTKKKLDDE